MPPQAPCARLALSALAPLRARPRPVAALSAMLSVALSAAALAGCGAAPPAWTWSDIAPSPPLAACAQTFDVTCEVTLLDARADGDRARWGQALVGLALADRGEVSAQAWLLVKALNPQAWVPTPRRDGLPLSPVQVSPLSPPAEVAALGGADPTPLGGRTAQSLNVPWPATSPAADEAAALASLASMWAQSVGAQAALLPDGTLVPVAPNLERLWGLPLAGIPASQAHAAAFIAEADRLLTANDPAAALLRLDDAARDLSDAAPCLALGGLHYLRARLAVIADTPRYEPLIAEAQATCVDAARLPTHEQPIADYLRHLLTLQGAFVDITSRAYWPAEWQTPDGIDAQARALDALRATAPARPAAILDALWQSARLHIDHSQDLCIRHLPLDAASLDAPRDRLSALGREDLAQSLYNAQLVQHQAASFARVADWVAWAQRHPWLRADLLGRGVVSIGMQSWLIPMPQATALACDALFTAQRQQIALDRSPGFTQRLARRWHQSLAWIPACGMQAVGRFGGDLLTHASAQGPDALLGTLYGMVGSGEALQTLMLHVGSAPQVAHALSLATKASRAATQGDTPDALTARAALTLLDIAAQEARALLGGAPSDYDLSGALHAIQRQLGDVPQATSGMAQYAPALRLCALSARALAAAFAGAPPSGDPLADLDAFLRADLATALAPFDAAHHAEPLRALGLHVLALHGAASDRAALVALSPTLLDAPTPDADDALGLLINLGQVALLEAHGALLNRADDRASARKSWDAAAARLPALSDQLVRVFDLASTSMPALLTLLPLAHHLILSAALAPDDGSPLSDHIFSPSNIQHIRTSLDAAEARLLASPDPAAMLLIITRALRDLLTSPSLSLATQDDPTHLATFADIITRQASPDSPPALRAALLTTAGILRFSQDQAAAQAQWDDTQRLLSSSHSADAHPLLLPLIALATADITNTLDPAATLTSLDAFFQQRLRCQEPSQAPFIALLPWRAQLLERLNRHAEADQTLQEYLSLVALGASGSAELSCLFESRHRGTVLSFSITAVIGGDLRPLSSRTFSMNLGFQQGGHNRDVIQCIVRPTVGHHPAATLNATLARAAFALRANDDATAATALRDSTYAALRLASGTYNVLGPVALPFSSARDQANLALLREVAAFALARGHVSSSIALQEYTRAIAFYAPKSLEDEPTAGTLSHALRPFPDLQPLATFATPLPDPSDPSNPPPSPIPATFTPAEQRAWAQIPGVLPWTTPLAPVLTRWDPTNPTLHAALAALCPPKSKAAHCAPNPQQPLPRALYRALLAAPNTAPNATSDALSLSDYRDLLPTLAAASDAQALARIATLLPRLLATSPPDQVLTLMDQTLQAIDPNLNPFEYASTLASIFSSLPAPESLDNFTDLMGFTADVLTDKTNPEYALRLHLNLFNYLGRLQRYDAMRARSEGLFHATSRLPNAEGPASALAVIHTLLRLLADDLPLRELDAWLIHWRASTIDPSLLSRLQATRDALSTDPAQARNLASQIIRSFF